MVFKPKSAVPNQGRHETPTVIEFRKKTLSPCASPIVIKRHDNDRAISILFHIGYFNTDIVELAMAKLSYGEESNWQLRKLDRNQNAAYVEYLLVLLKEFEQREETLEAIVGRIVKEVYLEEMHFSNDDISVSNMLSDGANIGNKTVETLLSANITTAGDLEEMSREEICQLPGMTTGEVVQIEKYLASRGMFLRVKLPPS